MTSMIKRFFTLLRTKSAPDLMKYLIVGIGNIGTDYEDTRHNIGFDVLDCLAKNAAVEWTTATLGAITEFKHKSRTFILLKPNTYVNRSGKAVRHWMTKHKIQKENLLVVLDDLNLPFGKQRLRGKGSDGGHNGLKDIDTYIEGNNYARLRIGIGGDFPQGKQADYVLGKWSDEERTQLSEIIDYAAETVKTFGTIGLAQAMSQRNKK